MFIQQTSHNTLSQFVVRDQDGSYENEYNEALIASEHAQALQRAGRELVARSLSFSLKVAQKAGECVIQVLDEASRAA